MPTVTVDADDLEALLFATSGIKDLEAALQQRKTNPLVKSGMGRMATAHYGRQVLGVTEADIAPGPSNRIGAQRLLGN